MGRPFGSRALLVTGIVIVALLASLAVVQYRWSTRIASADLQREKEHLESSAGLFAAEFNGLAGRLMIFLQNDAWTALRSGEKLSALPRLAGELYFLDTRTGKAQRLGSDGLFASAARPEWISLDRCATVFIDQPPALVTPVYNMVTSEIRNGTRSELRKSFTGLPDQCFVARIDEAYLRGALLPKLICDSFGETAASEYEFAVMSQTRVIYGKAVHPDLRKAFFAAEPMQLSALPAGKAPARATVFIRHMESTTITAGQKQFGDLFGSGIWELEVAHKGGPLSAAFEQRRRRDFLLSLGVELLLMAAMAFLIISARRMQDLANRKMRFVAGVSHELRTPVAAIGMLSRNQADGLVEGSEKVRQYGELIHQQSRRLNEMVEQALQYAGIHSDLGRGAKSPVAMDDLVRNVIEARREELARGGFELEVSLGELPAVPADAKLLRTAIDNLIDNAQKYAGNVRWIRVSAGYERSKREVWVEVEDRGIGIDAEDQADIFEPFWRGRGAAEAQIPGSGIGLSLVRSAAQAHGGRVTLQSALGRGSKFAMHIPV